MGLADDMTMERGARGGGDDPFYVVRWCRELDRVMSLPVRSGPLPDMTEEFRHPSSTWRLWPIQSACLHELRMHGGLFAAVGVGHGKTLVGLLAGRAVFQATEGVTVYLMPAMVKAQVRRDHERWNEHFDLPELDKELFLVSYEELSRADQAGILDILQPSLIVIDEMHFLRHKEAARTKRFLRYCRSRGPIVCGMSGTATSKSLLDYGHLAEVCLGKNMPLPSPTMGWPSLKEWSEALDSPKKGERVRAPGALLQLCTEAERGWADQTAAARAGYRRRFVTTPGVVASEEGALGTSLVITARRFPLPQELQDLIKEVKKTWSLPGRPGEGREELEDATRMWAVLRQLAMGFYYQWDWGGKPVDHPWLAARAAWHKAVREYLAHRAQPGMDSPLLLSQAAERGDWHCPEWHAWKAIKDRANPKPVSVWVSDFAAREVAQYLADAGQAIIWYEQQAFGQKVAEVTGVKLIPPGTKDIPTGQSVILSIKAFGTGLNLQEFWSKALVTCAPSSGKTWEQTALGRIHRPGQEADTVEVEWFAHTPEMEEAFAQAQRDATYQEQTLGNRQKLLYATKI